MDPNATLEELRRLIEGTKSAERDTLAEEIADRFEALDQWLSNGGFLPDAWNKNR